VSLLKGLKKRGKMRCGCTPSIKIGRYGNQVTVLPPFSNRFLCIDRCILDEISLLWSMDIVTTGCCCGHNEVEGFIGVEDQYIPQMKALGYEVQYNPTRPEDEDSFNLLNQ